LSIKLGGECAPLDRGRRNLIQRHWRTKRSIHLASQTEDWIASSRAVIGRQSVVARPVGSSHDGLKTFMSWFVEIESGLLLRGED